MFFLVPVITSLVGSATAAEAFEAGATVAVTVHRMRSDD